MRKVFDITIYIGHTEYFSLWLNSINSTSYEPEKYSGVSISFLARKGEEKANKWGQG